MNYISFLKLTVVTLFLPVISLASTNAVIFNYYKPFELEAVYVSFEEDRIEEHTLPLKEFESKSANKSDLIYQYWPKGTHPDWENNSMVYVSKDGNKTRGWLTVAGFQNYMNDIIRERYPHKNFHHSESGVKNTTLKQRITYIK